MLVSLPQAVAAPVEGLLTVAVVVEAEARLRGLLGLLLRSIPDHWLLLIPSPALVGRPLLWERLP